MKTSVQIFALLFSVLSVAQAPAIQWQKALGGTNLEYGYSVKNTVDGGYIIAGTSESNNGNLSVNHGNKDVWIVKLDNLGTISWQKVYGGSNYDYAQSIQQTSDGGYIVAGFTKSTDGDVSGNHGENDVWIIKLDNLGNASWKKTLGGTDLDNAFSIKQTMDGGYIFAGYTDSYDGDVLGSLYSGQIWIVKLDNVGTISWQKGYGGISWEDSKSIEQTSDGGYVFVGSARSNDGDVAENHGDTDAWVVKIDNIGNISWQKVLGGTGVDYANSIQQTSDGGYIVAGVTQSNDLDFTGNHGSSDAWIVKLDNLGVLSWKKVFGGSGDDYAQCVQQTSDSNYIIAGYTNSNNGDVSGNHGGNDVWVVKLNNLGAISWQKTLGGTSYEVSESIQQTPDGGYIVLGYSSSINGDVIGNHGGGDLWVVKLGADLGNENFENETVFKVYPNPSTSIVNILNANHIAVEHIVITDVLGKKTFETNKNVTAINVEYFQKGLYFIEIASEGKTVCKKFVKE